MRRSLFLLVITLIVCSTNDVYAQNNYQQINYQQIKNQQIKNQQILNDMDAYLQRQKMKEFEVQMKETERETERAIEQRNQSRQQMIQIIGNYIKEQNEQDEIIEKENKKKQELKRGETLPNLLNAFYITFPDITLNSKYTDPNSKDYDVIKSKELANELLKWKKIRISLQKTRNDSDTTKRKATIKYLKEIEENIIKNFS